MAINFPNSPTDGDIYGNFTYDTSIPGWRKTPENSASLPAGTIVQWPGATAPANWLLADGSAVSRTTYASLFAAIGTQYGSGDGTTTFTLPNLKGKVAVGLDSSQTEFDTLGEAGGAKVHTLTTAEMPSHTHVQDQHRHQSSWTQTYVASGGISVVQVIPGGSANFDTGYATATNQSTGGGGAHNNLQPYIVLNYIIKTSAGITSGDSELATRLAAVENKFDTGQNDAPAGSITQFAGSTVPTNWLLCDGAAVSRSTWPSLFSAIGTTYGVGDGATTFNLPDIPNGTGTGVVGQAVSTSVISVSSSTPSDMAGMTTTVALKAGRTYKITFSSSQLGGSTTSARARVDFYVGATFWERQYYGTGNTNYGAPFVAESYYTSPSDQTVVVKIQGSIDVGAGTFTWYADASYSKNVFTVEDMGESVSTASLRQKHIIKATAGVSTNDGTFVTRVGAVETSVNALQVADATTNKSGLVPIIPSSVTVASGSASVASDGTVTFSGASGISIDGVFSSTFRNYRAMTDVTSVNNAIYLWQGRVGGSTTSSTNYYYNELYASTTSVGAGGSGPSGGTNNGRVAYMEAGTYTSVSMDIYSPQVASHTQTFSTHGRLSAGGSPVLVLNTGGCQLTTQFTGMYLWPSAGTFSGTVKFYGYR